MFKRSQGFTIVELLIVIIVIAILVSVTATAFGGIQNKARNTARAAELKAWDKSLNVYKATYGNFPTIANGTYCLGTNFPVGYGGVARCRDYTTNSVYSYLESDNAALMTELKKVSSLPNNGRNPVRNTIGPYLDYYGTAYRIYNTFDGYAASDCPSGTAYMWADGAGLLICAVDSA